MTNIHSALPGLSGLLAIQDRLEEPLRIWRRLDAALEGQERLTKEAAAFRQAIGGPAIDLPWREAAAGLREEYTAVQQALGVPVIEPVWREVEAQLRERQAIVDWISQSCAREAGMLLKLGWPPVGLLPARLITDLCTAFERGEIQSITVEEVFTEFYDADELRKMMDEWRNRGGFPHRMAILSDAVEAHIEGRFALSIPAFLSQLEGAIAEIFSHRGRITEKEIRRYLKLVFARRSRYDRVAAAFYRRVLLARFKWGRRPRRLSGHAILHGADVTYPSAPNSLRLILFLDQLHRSIRYVAVTKGGGFHFPGCCMIHRRRAKQVYESRASAVEAGLAPCKRCLPG